MTSKKKKKIVIVIIIVVLIILISIGAVMLLRYIEALKNKDTSGLNVEPNVMLDKNATPNVNKVATINVNLNKIIKVQKKDNGKYSMVLNLTNGNEHQYMVSLSVDDVIVYTSDLIPAGATLPEVELDNIELESGTYDAVAIFTVVSEEDNKTVLGSTGLQLVLDVSK